MGRSGEPYYRISCAVSELEDILYDQLELNERLSAEADYNPSDIPSIMSIKETHQFPFRTQFEPVLNSANQFITHEPSSNSRFTIEYGGEFGGRGYQALDISAGTITGNSAISASFAFCQNFLASLLIKAEYKVSSDTLYKFPGEMYYVWYTKLVPHGSRPALMRCLRETSMTFKWGYGSAANTATDGSTRSLLSSMTVDHPYEPIQAYAVTHAAFTVYIHYNLFTLSNVKSAYPMVAIYALPRYLEYSFKKIRDCLNVWVDDGTPANGGLINPNDSSAVTWTQSPDITATRFIQEYFVVDKELQRMLAMNPHTFLIHQYEHDNANVTDTSMHTISFTKIIESIYIVARHAHHISHTAMAAGVNQINVDGAGTMVDRVFEIDPFSLPQGEKPINQVTISARGQPFYVDMDWEELSHVNDVLYSTGKDTTSSNHCCAGISFAHHYHAKQHTGSYNSGYGPNPEVRWKQQVFSQTDPGCIDFLIEALNAVIALKGGLTIRYV